MTKEQIEKLKEVLKQMADQIDLGIGGPPSYWVYNVKKDIDAIFAEEKRNNPMPNDKLLELMKRFNEMTDKYRKFAGNWHDETCDFPDVDQAVCNCDLPANKKRVKSLLSEVYKAGQQDNMSDQEKWHKAGYEDGFKAGQQETLERAIKIVDKAEDEDSLWGVKASLQALNTLK